MTYDNLPDKLAKATNLIAEFAAALEKPGNNGIWIDVRKVMIAIADLAHNARKEYNLDK